MKSNKEYVENPKQCPFCNSSQLELDDYTDFAGDNITSKVECLDCGAEWQEVYELTGFLPIKTNDSGNNTD